jgi:hypothetical protein
MGHTARGSLGLDREVRHLLNAAAGAGTSARPRRLGWSRRRGGREPPRSCGANEQRRSTLPQMRSNPGVHGSINLASGPRSRVTSAGRSSRSSGREDLPRPQIQGRGAHARPPSAFRSNRTRYRRPAHGRRRSSGHSTLWAGAIPRLRGMPSATTRPWSGDVSPRVGPPAVTSHDLDPADPASELPLPDTWVTSRPTRRVDLGADHSPQPFDA